MAGSSTVTVDLTAFQRTLKALSDHVPFDSKVVLKNEARMLVQELVKQSQPKKGKLAEKIKRSITFDNAKRQWGFLRVADNGATTVDLKRYYKWRGTKSKTSMSRQTVTEATRKAFIKQQQSHMGYFASGFIGTGNPLNVKVPGYISKFKPQGKTLVAQSAQNLIITVMNQTKFVLHYPKVYSSMVRIFDLIIKSRTAKMKANLEAIIKGARKYKVKA